jgi:hypothetical protein
MSHLIHNLQKMCKSAPFKRTVVSDFSSYGFRIFPSRSNPCYSQIILFLLASRAKRPGQLIAVENSGPAS